MTDSYNACPHECTTVEYIETRIDPDCACPVFVENGCVPHITKSDDSTVIIKTYLSDRERESRPSRERGSSILSSRLSHR